MIDDRTNYERYLANEPLTEELAQLQRGNTWTAQNLIQEVFGRPAAPLEEDEKPLSREDRLVLSEGRQLGVFTIYDKLLKKSLHRRVKAATIDSENDPLGRIGEIATSWAYIAVYRRIVTEFQQMVEAEIGELDK